MQVIDFAPSQLMIIEYHPMGIRGVHLGNMMAEKEVAKPPIEIYFDSHNKSSLHTLVKHCKWVLEIILILYSMFQDSSRC
jgi:hypothetical protein